MKQKVLPDRCNKIFSVSPMKSLALKQTNKQTNKKTLKSSQTFRFDYKFTKIRVIEVHVK